MKYFLILAVIISIVGKLYAAIMISFKRVYSAVKSPTSVKMFYLVLVAYIISLMQVNLTGGGEQFLLEQAQNGSTEMMWVLAVMLLHFGFSVCSVSSGLPGKLYPHFGHRWLAGAVCGIDCSEVRHYRTRKRHLCHVDIHVGFPGGY